MPITETSGIGHIIRQPIMPALSLQASLQQPNMILANPFNGQVEESNMPVEHSILFDLLKQPAKKMLIVHKGVHLPEMLNRLDDDELK